jgi:hypothetical protein
MGRPISNEGSDAAGAALMEVGTSPRQAVTIVDQIACHLEANEPAAAFSACKRLIGDDVTLHYRIVAVLLAHADADAPQARGGVGQEAVAE